jgi:hypothetical protein
MTLQGGFHDPGNFTCAQLKAHTPDWNELVAKISEEDIQSFVAAKMAHLKQHKERLEQTKHTYDEMLEGKMTMSDFIATLEARLDELGHG